MVTKKNLYNPGCVLDICAKNEVDPTIGLGGVREQTHTQRTYGYYIIDYAYIIAYCTECVIPAQAILRQKMKGCWVQRTVEK